MRKKEVNSYRYDFLKGSGLAYARYSPATDISREQVLLRVKVKEGFYDVRIWNHAAPGTRRIDLEVDHRGKVLLAYLKPEAKVALRGVDGRLGQILVAATEAAESRLGVS